MPASVSGHSRWRLPSSFEVLVVVLGLLTCFASGCADDGPAPDSCASRGQEVSLTLWNRSQFEAHEIRVHDGRDPAEPTLEFTEPLPASGSQRIEAFPSGSYLTYVRDESAFGPQIAVTTQSPVCVDSPGHTLVMFDSNFRLLGPDSAQRPAPDAANATGD